MVGGLCSGWFRWALGYTWVTATFKLALRVNLVHWV